ncbi:hypothetical protein DFJ74DRAFT_476093 [Hyaloraphidium curvatum]|nr:hypothetical protein DFJ74DRAFT_476093 [Hyaloraphidium curvatum]
MRTSRTVPSIFVAAPLKHGRDRRRKIRLTAEDPLRGLTCAPSRVANGGRQDRGLGFKDDVPGGAGVAGRALPATEEHDGAAAGAERLARVEIRCRGHGGVGAVHADDFELARLPHGSCGARLASKRGRGAIVGMAHRSACKARRGRPCDAGHRQRSPRGRRGSRTRCGGAVSAVRAVCDRGSHQNDEAQQSQHERRKRTWGSARGVGLGRFSGGGAAAEERTRLATALAARATLGRLRACTAGAVGRRDGPRARALGD